jgi:hypothetical protein
MQRRSAPRRYYTESSPPLYRNKRVVAVLAAVLAFAGLLAVTQISSASTRRQQQRRAACPTAPAAPATARAPGVSSSAAASAPAADPSAAAAAAGTAPSPGQTAGTLNGGIQNGRQVWNHVGDGQDTNGRIGRPGSCVPSSAAPTVSAGGGAAGGGASATPPSTTLNILGNSCASSKLAPHTGFQDGNRCVSTAFGEVGTIAQNPTLLITKAPARVAVGQAFTLQVSTRNLVRDRFLGAAAGGYYLESSFLNAQGLVRGHFHTACRMLASTKAAPDPAVAPAFFVATEDGGGGAQPDVITINVSGMPTAGTAQCASWAGDGSHRIPMMQKANETPAFDSVRITVG